MTCLQFHFLIWIGSIPNSDATLENLSEWGFHRSFYMADGGVTYAKDIQKGIHMYFLFNGDDGSKIAGQGMIIELDTLDYQVAVDEIVPDLQDECFLRNQQEFKKDSLVILDLLKTYSATKISNTERHAASDLQFSVKAKDSNDIYQCIYSAYPQRRKALSIEITWANTLIK